MKTCPACAGPAALGGDCATCDGITEVTQEVYDAFIKLHDDIANAHISLAAKLAALELNEHERDVLFGYGLQS